jgi:hypothetical protein
MITIPHRPMLAAALALLCGACGGPDADDPILAKLQADSAFSAPVTMRIPRVIRVPARGFNAGMHGVGDRASYGPEQYQQLNAPMNVLRAGGMVRLLDRSRRVLVHTSRIGNAACVPYRERNGAT